MKALGAFLLASFLLAALSAPPLPTLASAERDRADSGRDEADPEAGKTDSDLREVDGSGVHGKVLLIDLPAGGTLAVVNLAGLTPDVRYLVVRAPGGSCDIESYDEEDAIADVAANASGRATATLQLEQEIDELGTISVWTPEDALVACAAIQ
ncbi:MAG TPA: hypothetical protein VFP58_01125 [Candidatus Eisenbacteria bacterium]|nr:hypothetical protein [Candidatus Eisenbacteria bacterium]